MSMPPVVAALRKHKSGVVVIALEIALTLAIVCNAVFIVGQRVARVSQPTGLEESNLILIQQQWVGAPRGSSKADISKLDALQLADLAALLRVPGVADAAPVNSLPILGTGMGWPVTATPPADQGQHPSEQGIPIYQTDQRGLATLGLKLVAGRNFHADEVGHQPAGNVYEPDVILTRALAQHLFPHGHAVGQSVYVAGHSNPVRVVGIVARMQAPFPAFENRAQWYAAIFPQRDDGTQTLYAVRAQPGQMAAVMKAIKPALFKIDPMRTMGHDSVQSFATIRAAAYQGDTGMAIMMGVISIILVLITGAGIMGLTSFWVGQRRKQIGIRRALGARKVDIVRYFQIENLIIAGAGAALGVVLAIGLNLLLMQHIDMPHLPIWVVAVAVLFVLVLGQIAVFVPARRAANVPPVVATRSV
ncbi:MAG TPA: FtsX-like permease family protein [Rhodanobacteraceae bacterium]